MQSIFLHNPVFILSLRRIRIKAGPWGIYCYVIRLYFRYDKGLFATTKNTLRIMDLRQIRTNIRKYRLSQQISIETMSTTLKISPRQYRNLENGSTPISLERLTIIADILQVEVDLLTGRAAVAPHNVSK